MNFIDEKLLQEKASK